ncbi:uncharacterized protein PHACADRAFT_253639 [Phanerochaete carnosa HHB-10118-sp]|uniref:Uncharacterized protein n=1 Tax=Phanerochaete carnosa (strain HHB-10118-sp) TaxID=650164 RepID=K5X149_PHACS|nr:uncharacterized protein PHACADRAFT_253639 [Phanerochaete carnosa HHB-10118-sp]EKM56482.1 hypothetical protein PHACADRAFT_253639 [Phanerochaete carnosa HHB-10118-sp]
MFMAVLAGRPPMCIGPPGSHVQSPYLFSIDLIASQLSRLHVAYAAMYINAPVASALLAATAISVPSSQERHAARIARRAGLVHESRFKVGNETTHEISENWAGVVLNSPAGTYKSVTASFTVLNISEPEGSTGFHGASAWVGIDGDTCQTGILQTGLDFDVKSDDNVSFAAWYEFSPADSIDFRGISFTSGDIVTLTVIAANSTSGMAIITNNSTGTTVNHSVTSTVPLCGQDADFIVEDFAVALNATSTNFTLVPFANFSTVRFTGASAGTTSGYAVDLSGGHIIDMVQVQNNTNVTLTSVTVSRSEINITRIQRDREDANFLGSKKDIA